MAVAGKVAITLSKENDGKWSADVTYDRLVAVTHNNNLYISRKTVANVEPPNDEYWFLALEDFGGDDIEAILNGTTQVGNAKTLDGHGAEYFFPKTGGYLNGDLVAKADGDIKKIVGVENASRYTYLYTQDGISGLYDSRTGDIIRSTIDSGNVFNGTASGNLPLVNDRTMEIKTATAGTLSLNNTADVHSSVNYVQYKTSTVGDLGYLGFSAINNPAFMTTGGVVNDILHTGNKPTGTYTGNGDATARTISIGGVGKTVLVRGIGGSGTENFAIVSESGYVGKKGSEIVVGVDAYTNNNGDLIILSASDVFNTSGRVYYYEKL